MRVSPGRPKKSGVSPLTGLFLALIFTRGSLHFTPGYFLIAPAGADLIAK